MEYMIVAMYNYSPKKVLVGGNPYHLELIKSCLSSDEDFTILTDKAEIKNADLYYWIYGPGPSIKNYFHLLIHQKPKLIIHWIGTDVLNYQCYPQKFSLKIVRKIKEIIHELKGVVHLAGSPWLADELAALGIRAEFFPLTTIDLKTMSHENIGVNKTIDFLSYIPLGRFNFYGGDKLIKLAEYLPYSSFLVIMPDDIDISKNINVPDHPENITLIGKTDIQRMIDIYLHSKCFLRFTEHDGLSLSVLESMFYKLHVFWTYKFPHTIHVEKYEGLQEIMQEILSNWQPNEAGHNYVVKHYSTDVWKGKFREMLCELFR